MTIVNNSAMENDTKQFAREDVRSRRQRAEFDRESVLKASLELLNAAISALEATAWQGRELIEEAKQRAKEFDQDKDDVIEEVTSIANKAKKIPFRLKRMAKTALTLSVIVGSYRLWGTRSAFISLDKQQVALMKLHEKNARRFRNASLEHGGAFLKVGQLISARSDLMPESWIEELKVLQDQALPVPFREVKEIIEHELQRPIDQVFSEFTGEPIAAASIGQVHEARLISGERVAVKVQRPGIEETINQDMALMKLFLNALEPILPPTDIETISEEIERSIKKELSYRQESKWMQKIGNYLETNSNLIVPKLVTKYCSEKLLVSEFIDGVKLTDRLDELKESGNTEVISDLLGQLLDAYIQQVLVIGVFQADPHPGNILVTPDNKLVLLDFGCSMELPESFRLAYKNILVAALMGDKESVANNLETLGFKTRSGNPDTLIAFADALLENIKASVSRMANSNEEMHWPEGDEIFEEVAALLKQAEDDPVEKIPAEFILLARVFSTLGGMFTYYKPNLDVQKYLLPHLQQLH